MPDDSRKLSIVGRTGWDVLSSGRFIFLSVFIVIVSIVTLYFWLPYIGDIDFSFVFDCLPYFGVFVFALIIGWFICLVLVVPLFSIPSIGIVTLDFTNRVFTFDVMTKETFSQFSRTGNALSFSSPSGLVIYLARSVDWERKTIEFAWAHEVPIEQAVITLEALELRESDYANTKRENLFIRNWATIIGIELSKKAVRSVVSDISSVIDLDEFDIKTYLNDKDKEIAKEISDLDIVDLKDRFATSEGSYEV